MPVLYGAKGAKIAFIYMYCPSDKSLYKYTSEGSSPTVKYKNYVILCNRGIVTFERKLDGTPTVPHETETNIYNHEEKPLYTP